MHFGFGSNEVGSGSLGREGVDRRGEGGRQGHRRGEAKDTGKRKAKEDTGGRKAKKDREQRKARTQEAKRRFVSDGHLRQRESGEWIEER